MNKEAGTIIFTLELFLIANIRYHLTVNEHGKLDNHILRQTELPTHQPSLSSFLQPE